MAVRIGGIDLPGVQNLHTEESRTLVEQRVPEQKGSVFQDLGREPVTIALDGFLFGDSVLDTLETLRTAHAKAEPQSFAADLIAGTDLTEVVIETFQVRQVAGYASRYRFLMRLREHVEPPQSAAATNKPVDADVQSDATSWGDDSVAAAGVLTDPASLTDALEQNPALLAHLDMDDLGDSLMRNMDGLDASQLDGIAGKLAELNPAKAEGLFARLRDKGGMIGMLAKYVQAGIDFVKNIDPSKLRGLMKAFKGGLDFLKKLKQVIEDAKSLFEAIAHLELPDSFKRLMQQGSPA
nr:DNA circularization N-terminal domain-containing protein [uncultured Rhodopila sp.]